MLRGLNRAEHLNLDHRITLFALAIFFVFGAIGARLFWLQIVKYEYYTDLANRQHLVNTRLLATRGEIYARDHTNSDKVDLYPLAANKVFYEVYVDPSEVTRPQNTADALGAALGVAPEEILERVSKVGDIYEPIKHKVTDKELALIDKIDLPGIYTREEIWRYYPDGEEGSHILGFYGYQDNVKQGKYGLEGFWDSTLAGNSVDTVVSRTGSGNVLAAEPQDLASVMDGSDLVLTIDRTIQFEACSVLDRAIINYKAGNGSIVIMEPETGRILAMCSAPGFDPNNYNLVEDISNFNNLAVYEAFEPGSVFKAFAMSIALDDGKVTPATTYEDAGVVKIAGYEIKNSDLLAHGTQTMTEVLEKSLNTGMIFATQDIRNKIYRNYVNAFGFGQKYDLFLDQESAGDISSLEKQGDIHKATSSYGQGITVTALQLAAATSALANDGVLMKPYIVEEVIDPAGQKTVTQPEVLRSVIKPETAHQIAAMMVSVVDNGHAKKAALPGYYIAGKTGTAQIAENGQYTAKTVQSFIGFGPISNPKFAMVVKLHNPNAMYAESTAGPVFREVAQFLVDYYQIPPER